MKTSRIALICVSSLLLAGCATTNDRSVVAPERAPSIMDADAEYVAFVERVARRRGIHVTWVNAPRRRMSESAPTQ